MKQQGFLMVVAVILIVIVSLLIAGIVALFLRTTAGSGALQAIPQAAALATTAIEQGRSMLSKQSTCVTLNNTITLSTGTATTTSKLINPGPATAYLTTDISAIGAVGTIAVNDSSVYAPSGRVLIGREVFYYSFIASPTELGGVSRAQDLSIATSHVKNDFVAQYQCSITGTGTSQVNPSVSAQRQYTQLMQQQSMSMVFAVAGGSVWARNNQNNSQWAIWKAFDSPPVASNLKSGSFTFLSVSMLNYNEGWAVGPGYLGDIMYYPPGVLLYAFYQLSPSYTSHTPIPNPNRYAPAAPGFPYQSQQYVVGNSLQFTSLSTMPPQLQSVDAVSSSEAWAVGSPRMGSGPFIMMRWTATTGWALSGLSLRIPPSISNFLVSIKMIDVTGNGYADYGFVVGGTTTQQPLIYEYQNSSFSLFSIPSSTISGVGPLMSVDITPFRNGNQGFESFFAGFYSSGSGVLLRFFKSIKGTNTWGKYIAKKPLHQVSVIDTNGDGLADFGCAVGEGGTVIFFGNNFSNITSSTVGDGNAIFTSVALLSSDDIWVGGYESSPGNGVLYHYDGSSWTQDTSIRDPITGIRAPITGMSKVAVNNNINVFSPVYETIN